MEAVGPAPWGRKYLAIIFPTALGVAYLLSPIDIDLAPLLVCLSIGLAFQNAFFHCLYTESISEFSSILATRPIPLRVSSLFGPKLGTIAIITISYAPGFLALIALSFITDFFADSLLKFIFASISLSLILQPMTHAILSLNSTSAFTSINTIGTLYLATLLIGLAGVPAMVYFGETYTTINFELLLFSYVTYVILLARAHHIIHISFNQKTGLAGFSISILPLALFLIPQLEFLLPLI